MSLRHTLQQSFRDQGLPLGTTDTDELQDMIKQSVSTEDIPKFYTGGAVTGPIETRRYSDYAPKPTQKRNVVTTPKNFQQISVPKNFLEKSRDFLGSAFSKAKEFGGKLVEYVDEKGLVENYLQDLVDNYEAGESGGVPTPAEYGSQFKSMPKKAAQTVASTVEPFTKGPVPDFRRGRQGNYFANNLANAVNKNKDAVAFIASQLLDVNKANLPDISTQINVTKAPVIAAATNPNIKV
jgi:hypothetical protein